MLDAIIDDFKLSDFGIALAVRPAIPTADQEVTFHDGIDELDGALTEYGALKNREFDLKCNMLEDAPIVSIIRRFRAKILQPKEYKLSLSDDKDFYYLVKRFKIGDIESEIAEHGEFTIQVTADPYDYKAKVVEARGTNSINVSNNGTADALPIITLRGSGDISLRVGDYSLSVDDLNGRIVIDREKYDYYDPDRPAVRVLKVHAQRFPVLKVGENQITTTGNVTELSVEFKERFR
ncbi:phage tail domain-containing protein [Streptococcus suis]|uniref:phage tail domain-containing protein n=1 Tax=Streptococcus suis TaxID=1307 RepID=UPI000CF5286B|nr:phage tail domain-containing protein [Streptococcus suis]MBL6503193.1 phage tail family protein [Streptococcus suis]MBM0241167.1 phage tail family protein [Streptococcus suis]MBM7153931.1 phage tail family protein [Streptococcus suis]MBM7204462.1 phage tail family protein [Streptococcus suis]MBM7281349.1 phage tail family protein [Streptococcus suis]